MDIATRQKIIEYGLSQLGCSLDAPFRERPEYEVLRHPLNNKWVAAVFSVPAAKVGCDGNGDVDIMNVKLDPLLVSSLKTELGYAPAWHMNKENWLTVILDGPVSSESACALLDMSYALVGPKTKRKEALD